MAGFEVITYGRFWVIAEGSGSKRTAFSSSVAQPVMWRSAKGSAMFAPLPYLNAT
jgi:hypothetical protein